TVSGSYEVQQPGQVHGRVRRDIRHSHILPLSAGRHVAGTYAAQSWPPATAAATAVSVHESGPMMLQADWLARADLAAPGPGTGCSDWPARSSSSSRWRPATLVSCWWLRCGRVQKVRATSRPCTRSGSAVT